MCDHDNHLPVIMSGLAYVQMCFLLFLEFKQRISGKRPDVSASWSKITSIFQHFHYFSSCWLRRVEGYWWLLHCVIFSFYSHRWLDYGKEKELQVSLILSSYQESYQTQSKSDMDFILKSFNHSTASFKWVKSKYVWASIVLITKFKLLTL